MSTKLKNSQPQAKNTKITTNCKVCGAKFTPKASLIYICPQCYLKWCINEHKKVEEVQSKLTEDIVQKSTETNEQLFSRAVEIFKNQLGK